MVRRLSLDLSYSMGVRVYLWSQLAKYIPGGVWSFANVGVSATQLGLPASLLMLIYIISTMLVLCVSILFAFPLVLLSSELNVAVLPLMMVIVSVFVLLPVVLNWTIRKLMVWRAIHNDVDPSHLTSYPTILALLVVFSMVHFLAFAAFYLYFTSLSGASSSQGLYAAMAWSGSWFVGLVVLVVPSGLGVREGTLVALLAPVVPASVAVALAFGYRLFTTVLDLLVLLGLLLYRGMNEVVRRNRAIKLPARPSRNL